MEVIKAEGLIPSEELSSSRQNFFNVKRTDVSTEVLGVMSPPVRSPIPGVRTASFLTDHQLELRIRALQAAQLLEQDPAFWLMQGMISADSFGHYRLELSVDLTKEEGD